MFTRSHAEKMAAAIKKSDKQINRRLREKIESLHELLNERVEFFDKLKSLIHTHSDELGTDNMKSRAPKVFSLINEEIEVAENLEKQLKNSANTFDRDIASSAREYAEALEKFKRLLVLKEIKSKKEAELKLKDLAKPLNKLEERIAKELKIDEEWKDAAGY